MREATTANRNRFVRSLFVGLALMLAQISGVQAQNYSFTTLTGGRVGDGGLAVNAVLGWPTGVVRAPDGTLYVAEFSGHRVRAIGADGAIRTVAGTGAAGYGGDGGAATAALLDSPQELALDANGVLYVADTNNHRIRRIAANGVITTVAGNGNPASAGDGGSALAASLYRPYGLAFDAAGNLYVSEMSGHRIRKIAVNGMISTYTGTGVAGAAGDGGPATSAQIAEPAGLGIDASGNLHVADSRNGRIRKITPAGTISTVVGGGVGGLQLSFPYGLEVSAAGDLYIGDASCVLFKVHADGTVQNMAGGNGDCTYNGDGPAADANVDFMEGFALDPAGNLYVSDSGNYRLRRIASVWPYGITTVGGIGSFEDGDATHAVFSMLAGVATNGTGDVFVADTSPNGRIRKITPQGQTSTVAGTGGYYGTLNDGNAATMAFLSYPADVDFDGMGRMYIADRVGNRIRRVDANGIISTVAGNGTTSGYSGDGVLATQTKLNRPRAIAVAADGTFYIADQNNHRVRRVDTDGTISTVAGTGVAGFSGDGGQATNAMINGPYALALDGAGNLYISDYGNARIRKVTPAGIITTYAGNGTLGEAGLGGLAVQASINRPTGLAVDGQGQLFVAAGTLRVVGADGIFRAVQGLTHPAWDVAVGSDGSLYVAVQAGRVLRGVVKELSYPKTPRAPAPSLPPLSNRK
jgi:sugar lactone lactonase YvrE